MPNIIPVLKISDYRASQKFYVEALGFSVDWLWRDPVDAGVFAQISHGDVRLYLSDKPDYPPQIVVYWYVEDVDALHRELLSKAIGVDAIPQDKPWRNREMQLSDPDGNCLRICTPL